MKHTFKILISLLSMLFIQSTYATQAPWELQATMVSDTSIEIDWQDVPDVLWYYIYYWESTGISDDYDIEWVDLIENSEYKLTDLNPETPYYIAVTAVDDTGSESGKSPELEALTLSAWSESQAVSLRIMSAKAIDDTSIEMEFSLDMETWSTVQRQFIIQNNDTGEEIWVDISDVIPGKPRNVLAILDGKLLSSSQYKITVLDIRDKNGNTIESWIDAFINFTTPEVFISELESAGTSQEVINEVDTNIDDQEVETQIEETVNDTELVDDNIVTENNRPLGNNAGKTISNQDLSGNTLNAAAENDKLPETGPEHWILLLVWVMLSTWLFYRFKK